jgi:predicted dehydrogenase
MICRGHETWHPDPEFYYKRGGGPMLDMGPYYVTALINLLGGVKGVTAAARKSFDTRVITSQPHFGAVVDVDVDTYVAGIMHFDSGAIGTIFTTFDVYYGPRNQARLEIYGTEGTLFAPDPNTFGGPVRLFRPEDQRAEKAADPGLLGSACEYTGFKEMPLMFGYRENSRALGLADMCRAIETGREFRSSCQQTEHVLEILTGFEKSARQNAYLPMRTRYVRAMPMKRSQMPGTLD